MAERKNKEYKIKLDNSFKAKYGSTDKDNPKVVYINGSAWMIPPKIEDIKTVIPTIERNVKNFIKFEINNQQNLDKSFILDFDLKPDSIIPGRRKFISFELFVRQRETKSLSEISNEMKEMVSKITCKIERELMENEFEKIEKAG